MAISLAYLFNWYPQPSLTALRREITAVEDLGLSPHRFTLRPFKGQLVDESDLAERGKTRAALDAGVPSFLLSILRVALSRPRAFARALRMAVRVGRVDERGLVRNFIYLSEACLLLGWMNELGIEHVHTHYGTNSATVAMLCRLLGGPTYSFTMHGPEESTPPGGIACARWARPAQSEWRNSTTFTEKPGNSSSCSSVRADLRQGSPGDGKGTNINDSRLLFSSRD